MSLVLMPLPAQDFDPTEAAVTWSVLTRLGVQVAFATPDGKRAEPDMIMLTGRGLDPWGFVPGLDRLVLLGGMLAADRTARTAFAAMRTNDAFRHPLSWDAASRRRFDGLILPGGHRARGMRAYLESPVLQGLVASFFAENRPVGAICHGVVLAARSRQADGKSVLHGRKTTALTWDLERLASRTGKVLRFWDPTYYRTYPDPAGAPPGAMSVEQEVTRALAAPDDFQRPARRGGEAWRQRSGLFRDSWDDPRPAFVVQDGNYVSARWPGDTHSFAKTFAALLTAKPAAEVAKPGRIPQPAR